jgi:beta-lactam-binding protein with PASTA domain
VTTVDVADDQYPPGYVRAQSPLPDTLARGGSTVILEVANGQSQSIAVPGVLGMTPEDATAQLRAAALQVEVVTEQEPPSPGAEDRVGLVWKQSPAGGSFAGRGDAVTIWVNPQPD